MRQQTYRSWLPIITLGCLLATQVTAKETLLKLEGIDGESKDNIEISSSKKTKLAIQKSKSACLKSGGKDKLTKNCSLRSNNTVGAKPAYVRKAGDDPLEYIVITN